MSLAPPPLLQTSPQLAQSIVECGLHTPLQQNGSGAQVCPQLSQLLGSLLRSTQPPLQQVVLPVHPCPPLQRHCPPTHWLPLLHGGLQPELTHMPIWHICPVGQGGLSQPPQCCGPGGQQTSMPLQPLPPLQVHWPPMHCSPW
jgi:hypothetical protein